MTTRKLGESTRARVTAIANFLGLSESVGAGIDTPAMPLEVGTAVPAFQPQSIDARDDATRRCADRATFESNFCPHPAGADSDPPGHRGKCLKPPRKTRRLFYERKLPAAFSRKMPALARRRLFGQLIPR